MLTRHLTKEEENEYLLKYKAGDKEAGNVLALSIYNWAMKCVRHRTDDMVDKVDQDGLTGLIIAKVLHLHNPDRGRLSTLIWHVTRKEVRMHLAMYLGPVYVPPEAHLAKDEDVRIAVEEARAVTIQPVHIPDRNHLADIDNADERPKWQRMYVEAMQSLKTDRYRDILHRKHQGETFESISSSYSISHQRVQQIVSLAALKFSIHLMQYWTEDWQPMSPLANRRAVLEHYHKSCHSCKLKSKCKLVKA